MPTQQPVMPRTPAEWQALSARARELQMQDQMRSDIAADAQMKAAAEEAERTRTRTLGEHVQDAGIALIGQGLVGLGQAGYGLANMATGGFLDRGTSALGLSGSNFFQDAQQYLEESKSAPMQLRRQHMLDTFKNEGTGAGLGEALSNPTLIADMVMANAAQLIPAVAAGARVSAVARAAEAMPAAARAAKIAADRAATVAKGASVAEAEATALAAAKHAQTAIVDGVRSDAARKLLYEDTMRRAMYGVTAAQTAGSVNVDAINAAEAAGATPGEAQLLGLGAAAAAGATSTLISKLTGAADLEAAAARAFFNKTGVGAGGKLADRALAMGVAGAKGAAREGVEEYGQSYGEQGFTNLAGAKPFTKGANQAGVMGALVGMPLGGGLGAFNARSGPAAAQGTVFDETAAALEQEGLKASLASKSTQYQNGLNSDRQIINEAQMTGDASQSGQQELALVGAQNVPTVPGPVAPPQLPTASPAEVSPNQLDLGLFSDREYAPETDVATQQVEVSPDQLSLPMPVDLLGDPATERPGFDPIAAADTAVRAPENSDVAKAWSEAHFRTDEDGEVARITHDHFDTWHGGGGVTRAVGSQYDSHGIAKTNPLGSLLNMLQNGVDTTRGLHTAPLANAAGSESTGAGMGTASDGAYKDGPFIVLSGRGSTIRDGGIQHVLVSDTVANVIPSLQARFPNVRFTKYSNAQQVLSTATPANSAPSAQNDLFNPTLPQITGRSSAVVQAPAPRPAVTAPVGSVARARQVVAQNRYDVAQGVDQAARSAALDAVDARPLNAPGKAKAPGIPNSELEDAIRQLDVAIPATWAESAGEAASPQVRKSKTWQSFVRDQAGIDPRSDAGHAAANTWLAANPRAAVATRNAVRSAAGLDLERTPAQIKAAKQEAARAEAAQKAAAAAAAKEARNKKARDRRAAKKVQAEDSTATDVGEALDVLGAADVGTETVAPGLAANDARTDAPAETAQAKAKRLAAERKAAPAGKKAPAGPQVTKKQHDMLMEATEIINGDGGVEVSPVVVMNTLLADGAKLDGLTAITAVKRYQSHVSLAEQALMDKIAGKADEPVSIEESDNNTFDVEDFNDPNEIRRIIDDIEDNEEGATFESLTRVAITEALATGDMNAVRNVYRAVGGLDGGKKAFTALRGEIEKAAVADALRGLGTADAAAGYSRLAALVKAGRKFSDDAHAFGFSGRNDAVSAAAAQRAVSLAQADINDATLAAPGAARQGVAVQTPQQVADGWTGQAELLGFTDADIAAINETVGNAEFIAATTSNPDARFSRNSDDGFGNPMGTVIRLEVWERLSQNAQAVADARGDKLVHVPTTAALAQLIGPVPSDAKGAFLNGTIYMVQENITGASDYAMVFAHESAHHGLSSMLGTRTSVVVSRVMANQAMRKRVSARMRQDPSLTRAAAAEEVIVDMHVAGERLPSGVMAKIRAGVLAFFDTILGIRQMVLTDNDINRMLDGIGRYQLGDRSATLGRIANMDQFALLDSVSGDSGFLPHGPMFSRDLQSLEAAVAAANGTARSHTLSDYVRDAGSAAKNVVAKQLDSARTGGFKGWLLDFMPLDQVRNHYARYFGGDSGPMGQLLRRVRAREALTNSTLVTDATAMYEGQLITTNPKALADKWGKFNRDGATAHKARAMGELLQVSTLYKVFPNRAGGLENQEGINYKDAGFTEEQRANALRKAQAAWRAIGADGQQIFNESQAMYRHLWTTRYEALASDIVRIKSGTDNPNGSPAFQRYQTAADGTLVVGKDGKPVQTKEFRAAIGDAIESQLGLINGGPYSPLSRYGEYVLIVRDAEGKLVHMSGHDSTAERATEQAALFRSGGAFEGTGFKPTNTVIKDALRMSEGINHDVIESLTRTVDATVDAATYPELHRNMLSALTDTYLKSLPQSSFMQHANKRKNTAGASKDAFRAFNEYTLSAARNIAGATHASAISEYAAKMQMHIDAQQKAVDEGDVDTARLDTQQAVMNSVKRHMNAASGATRSAIVDRALQAGFLSYMVSPSQMFINAMQTAMVAFPRLAGVYGARSSLKSMSAAVKMFAASRGDMMGANSALDKASVEGQVMEQLYKDGVFDFTRTNDMAATARGAHHVAEYGTTQGAGTRAWTAGVEAGAKFITASEKFNRQVTALAAVQLEMQANPQTPAENIEQFIARVTTVADRAVYDSHYDYSQSNKPTHMQSPAGALVTQFMQYQLNTLSMMTKDIIDAVGKGDPAKKTAARNTLAWMLGAQMTFAGAAGTVLAPIVFAAMDLGRDDDDLVDSRTRFMQHHSSLLTSGILAWLVDPQRIGADTLIPYLGAKKYAPTEGTAKDNMLFHLSQIVGPWFGMVTGTATGLEKVADGDLAGAFGTTGFLGTPKLVVDATKAMDQAYRGVRDGRGIKYDDPSVWDTALSALGLRSGSRRSTEDMRGAVYEATMHGTSVKKRIVDGLAKARTAGDNAEVARITEEMRTWNKAHPDLAIKGQDVARAVKGRIQSQRNADAYGVPVFKAPSASIVDAANIPAPR